MSEQRIHIPSVGSQIRIQRSGFATLCRYAYECLRQNQSALIVVENAESANQVRSILPVFGDDRENDDVTSLPFWETETVDFVPFLDREGQVSQASCLASLYALTKPGPHCVIATPESLLLRHVPLDFFSTRCLTLSVGEDRAPKDIIHQAVQWGYVRVPMVAGLGDIAVRGDIMDIFPPGYPKPLRLEFFGDTVEEIRIFDADTQRSRENITSLRMLPLSPCPATAEEQQAAEQYLDSVLKAGKLSENTQYTIRKAVKERNLNVLPASVFADSTFLEQWLPSDTVWFLPEEKDLVIALDACRERLRSQLDNEENALVQPVSLVLRKPGLPAPWPRFSRFIFSELLVGEQPEGEQRVERPIATFDALFPEPGAKDRPWQALIEGLKEWRSTYDQVLLCFLTARGRTKFLHLAAQDGISPKLGYTRGEKGLFAIVAPFRKGVELVWEKTLILGEDILFPRAKRLSRRAVSAFRGLHSFDSIREGELLVHRDYGIGRFGGLHRLTVNGVMNEFLLIEYAGHDKLYVPADNLSLIQRYKGGEGGHPALSRLGGPGWRSSQERARKAIEKIAADLVEMYAYRKVAKGYSYGPLKDIYREFEATFAYEETPDQAQAIQDVLDDMEKPVPMDRLICGDVGFGKTEVALRAAVRAASEGRQVALLCPTTVLAEQHYQTFRSRLSGFPFQVGLLSRFVSRTRQREVLEAVACGSIDILIGTHRLLSNDVIIPNLGLLILDEEQRFGVRHKEKMKELKKDLDVLTLTATPIPRTLQMSMSGIRGLSLIETPPENRKPVTTVVVNRDDTLLRNVLLKEMGRKGQIFWVYNRVRGIENIVTYIRKLVPEAKIGVAHGQMSEAALEKVMYAFWHEELDVLVSTAIVESGLDFPNVNTIIVDQAQMFGLGQLYQLRGRVGRSERQAYAYLIVPNKEHLPPVASERLQIIQTMDYLGAGFQLAMEDLRLRGAGNILGEVQTGQMSRVGLDMYLEMLEEAVARIQGTPFHTEVESEVNIGLPAHIPLTYIDDSRERMRFYKGLTAAAGPGEREEIMLEMRDRFGTLPQEVLNFIAVLNFKAVLRSLEVTRADVYETYVKIVWPDDQTSVSGESLISFVSKLEGSKISPPATFLIPLRKDLSFEKALAAMGQDLLSLRVSDAQKTGRRKK